MTAIADCTRICTRLGVAKLTSTSGIDLAYLPAVYPKYGVSAIFAAQSISQVEDVYGKNWEAFSTNANCTSFYATESEATIAYIHRKLGTCTVRVKVAPQMTGQRAREENREQDVMTQDDIRRYLSVEKGNGIVFPAGGRPVRVKNTLYFRECSVWQVDPDPQYKEPFQRAWARKRVENFLAKRAEHQAAIEPSGLEP